MSGAPEGAELFNKFYIRNVHSEGCIDHFAKWNGCKWQQAEAHREFVNEAISLNDLRTAIAEYDNTDHVTDIRNHLSPSTVVIEHE
ncbi:MAG: hypothetical protein RSC68_21185 [Acinetobacter sp.]